jgi:hypothetical protein
MVVKEGGVPRRISRRRKFAKCKEKKSVFNFRKEKK